MLTQPREARDLDPLMPYTGTSLAFYHYMARQYDQAIVQLREFIQANPNFAIGHFTLSMAYEGEAMFAEAIAEMN